MRRSVVAALAVCGALGVVSARGEAGAPGPTGEGAAPTASTTAAPPSGSPNAACGAGEVSIPATPPEGFTMMKGQKGAHRVTLTHAFCMDATEVTVAAYKRCVEADVCKLPWEHDPYSMYPDHPDYPVNLVSWSKARVYCAWVNKRLPTEAEWEWAATGPEQNKYAWGNAPEPDCEHADFTQFGAPRSQAGGDVGCHGGGPSPVGAHPKGDRLWQGAAIHDLAGNVWEWVEDSLSTFSSAAVTDPLVRNEGSPMHPLRGGAWNRSFGGMAITYRAAAVYNYQVPGVGFRCVRGEAFTSPPPSHAENFGGNGWKKRK